MPLVYDNTRTARQGGGWIERPDVQAFATTELPRLRADEAQRYQDSKHRWGIADKAAMAASMGLMTGGAASAFAGGGGAAIPSFATEGVGFSSAGSGAMSSIPWWNVASKGVDTLFGIYSNRQQSRANRDALAYQERQNMRAEGLDRDAEAQRHEEFLAQQAALKQQWDAMQKFEADKWAASEDERLYDRGLKDAREARLAPRRALAADALQRIPGLLASGRTSPGLGSLGSYRRG